MDPGETHEDAARREILEETGLQVDDVGPRIYQENIPLPYDDAIFPGAHQEFFAVSVTAEFEPDRSGWTESEHIDVTKWAWWTVEELRETQEPYEPRQLPDIMKSLFNAVERGH